MKEGDYLTCKTDCWYRDPNSWAGDTFEHKFFKKYKKYKIQRVNYSNQKQFNLKTYYIENEGFREDVIYNYFYSIKEERKMKLKNICDNLSI